MHEVLLMSHGPVYDFFGSQWWYGKWRLSACTQRTVRSWVRPVLGPVSGPFSVRFGLRGGCAGGRSARSLARRARASRSRSAGRWGVTAASIGVTPQIVVAGTPMSVKASCSVAVAALGLELHTRLPFLTHFVIAPFTQAVIQGDDMAGESQG